MKVLAILKKKHNDKTGKSEWALVSKKSGRVLRWFGGQHPSADRVQKEERRIQYFKHHGSVEEGTMIDSRKFPTLAKVLGGVRARYPALQKVLATNTLAAPINIEDPRKDLKRSEEVAEKKIDEIKKLVKKDMEDFIKEYKQLDFYKAHDKEGKDTDQYRYDSNRKKEVYGIRNLFVEEDNPKPAQPKQAKGHDEGGLTLYSKNKTLAPGVEHEELDSDKSNQRSYERNKAIWVRIGFSWEQTDDAETPKIFWWEGHAAIIRDPVKEDYLVKRKHEYKDYAEIERYMSKRLHTDEIIRDTTAQHAAQIKAKVAPILEQVRAALQPLVGKSLKFANFPQPLKLELKESEDLNDEDQEFYFKIMADPKKSGYDPFKVFLVQIRVGGGKFHTPYEIKWFSQYFNSDFELTSWDSDSDDLETKIDAPDFSKLKELVAEVSRTMERAVPILEVDEDEIEEEPKQLEAPEEESA